MDDIKQQPLGVPEVSKQDVMQSAPSHLLRTRRQPANGWAWPKFRELWEYRELLFFFAWRDIKVRYRQTVLGAVSVPSNAHRNPSTTPAIGFSP